MSSLPGKNHLVLLGLIVFDISVLSTFANDFYNSIKSTEYCATQAIMVAVAATAAADTKLLTTSKVTRSGVSGDKT